ncbi:hypothetical protein [Paraburkholderia sp. SUR17]|uniref:hypothetical protein n=1 Tax=Paraburkholderia sp. SUR17 TaxID=3034358 RepID=UPI002407AB2A|nr:hypothetical protein [Paraburkholderia sp. SUR17]WEY37746.1 hypothetical protein P2869_11725 [Paraburkholderia sp. SUR17]
MKTQASIAWKAGAPLTIEEVDLEGPRAGEMLIEVKPSVRGFRPTPGIHVSEVTAEQSGAVQFEDVNDSWVILIDGEISFD